jgi:hypothetical protein
MNMQTRISKALTRAFHQFLTVPCEEYNVGLEARGEIGTIYFWYGYPIPRIAYAEWRRTSSLLQLPLSFC